MTRADIAATLAFAAVLGGLWAASTWHSARTLDVICTRGAR